MAEKWLQDFFTQQQVKQARKQSLFLVTDWDKEMKLTPIKSRFLLLLLSFSQHNRRGIAIDGYIGQMISYSSSGCLQMKNCGAVWQSTEPKCNLWLFSPFGHFTCNLPTSPGKLFAFQTSDQLQETISFY